MSYVKKFTFAISSPDEFLVRHQFSDSKFRNYTKHLEGSMVELSAEAFKPLVV